MRRPTHRVAQSEAARGPRSLHSRFSEALYELRNEKGTVFRATFALPRNGRRRLVLDGEPPRSSVDGDDLVRARAIPFP
jgi:hypothetical protein